MSENTKAATRAVFEVWSTGAIERFDDLVARDVVHHDAYDPNAAEGLDGMTRTIELNRRAFPDMRLVVEDQVPARALADNGAG
jgi:ketosteroid isomerase-like protein